MKTNELRKLIKAKLDTIATSYYQIADEDAMYPHIVFEFKTVDLRINRDDYVLEVNIYERGNVFEAESKADRVVDMLRNLNNPTDIILPTFFVETRISVPDEDKSINHINIRFIIQNYEV